MEIPSIKHHLDIFQVAEQLGIKVDPRTKRALCPFHDDKNPSLQFSKEKQIATCFSSNCTVGTMDVIKLTEKKLQKSTHETLNYLSGLIGEMGNGKAAQAGSKIKANEESSEDFPILFKKLQENLTKGIKAKQYCIARKLNIESLEIGYNNGTYEHSRNCIIFPLKDQQNNIVSFYGRSISNNKEQKHFYLKDRTGLYPNYPKPDTEKLILTEAVIDAATLLQIPEIKNKYEILTCYGTNGLTQEHKTAIQELKQLKEIIFTFDKDNAGNIATTKYAEELRQEYPHLILSKITLPPNGRGGLCKDVNETAQSHSSEIFIELINNRIFLSIENSIEKKNGLDETLTQKELQTTKENNNNHQNKNEQQSKTIDNTAAQPIPSQNKIDTSNPYKLKYRTQTANYYIQGGVSKALDSMRVTLVVEEKETLRKSRNKIDLYEDKQIEKTAREVSEKLQLRSDLLETDIYKLTDLLEEYREKEIIQNEQNTDTTILYNISKEEEKKLIGFLTKENLIYHISELLGKSGIVGEEKNRIFLFAIAVSHICNETLHAQIQGSSGSGKTRLLRQISDCMPAEKVERLTRISDKGLYNYPEYYLCNKLLSLEDADGLSEEAEFAYREMVSNGELISSISEKDESSGRNHTVKKKVRGPIASLSCTTNGRTYEDNISRMFIVAVDESKEQTQKVIAYQNAKSAGKIDTVQEQKIKYFLQKLVRMLKPLPVINPYADKILLPPEAHKLRRLNDLFKIFIHQITIINQYRRIKDKAGRLISTKEDVKIAVEVMFNSIVLKVDELDGSLRQFYEKLKEQIKKTAKENYQNYTFTQREIRQALHISKTQLQRFLQELTELEYLQPSGGYANRGFRYKIIFWDDYKALRERIKKNLYEQLENL